MEDQHQSGQPDALLLPFLQASGDAESQRHLQSLIEKHAAPIIRSIVIRKSRVSLDRGSLAPKSQDEQDAEDMRGEAIAQLVSRLQQLRTNPGGETIGNFAGYVAVTAYRACDQHLRRKHPWFWRLKNRLRYLLTHQSGLALWEVADNRWLCGFAAWRDGGMGVADPGSLDAGKDTLARENPRTLPPADLVAAILDRAGGPIELDTLVRVFADLRETDEATRTPIGDVDTIEKHQAACDSRANVGVEVELRAYLRGVWREIYQLPPRQRMALLLNLRDDRGRGVIALFPLIGIATMRQIADVLEMPAEQFAKLCNDLPLDDATIAGLLSVTRQQVINLRKVARERLARRMTSAGF